MLHELLLSLSGHPSPLLKSGVQQPGAVQSLLSPAELTLLASLTEDLGGKHKSIRDNANIISNTHESTVCRAVASAILSGHLANFQRRVLEVEKDILSENANIVGAYNIVPLSALLAAFDGWGRKLKWLYEIVHFMQAAPTRETSTTMAGRSYCTAAMLIEKLRNSMHTGYLDIGEMSLDLVQAAETAWLKQASAWVLYGCHPGATDFFVTARDGGGDASNLLGDYTITDRLLPIFVTPYTANSILFVGKSLKHIRGRQSSSSKSTSGTRILEMTLLQAHLAQLSAVQSPINSASFTAAIDAIRSSLSQNALQKLLPLSKVLQILQVFKSFFLLERGEFAVALITAADERLNPRYRRGAQSRRATPTLADNLASMTIGEGEVHVVLARTWNGLMSPQGLQDDEDVDEELDYAREFIHLTINSIETSGSQKRELGREQAPAFDDLLLPTSTALKIKVLSPLDLFLSTDDNEMYSRIHAYLIGIRRGHLRLSKLFQLSKVRRDYPTPRAPAHLSEQERKEILKRKRLLSNQRTKAMRPIWAAIGSATFFLAEVCEFFQGEIVQQSWATFHSWLVPPVTEYLGLKDSNLTSSFTSLPMRPNSSNSLGSKPNSSRGSDFSGLHDPESLSQAHRSYLASLERSLLLDDVIFTRPLRRFLTAVDHLIALMQRLDVMQTSLDIETDAGSDHSTSHFPAEEQQLMNDLRGSLLGITTGVNELVEVLKNIDNGRVKSKIKISTSSDQGVSTLVDGTGFVPWSSKSLDRLLLKFDYGPVEKLTLQQSDLG